MRIGTLALPVGEDEETADFRQQRASLVRQRCYIGDLCQSVFGASNCSRAASWLQEALWSSREVWELPSFPSM
eukprot:symbB.v1.2.010959.t1/scaffold727.1/size198231/4